MKNLSEHKPIMEIQACFFETQFYIEKKLNLLHLEKQISELFFFNV